MSEVFISYRQTDDRQKQRVKELGTSLRGYGINVILDQFFLEENPGGPNDGWDKWSSDRALNSEFVLIIGTDDWFQCFDKKQPSGTGFGAACEADDLRHRIYEANGVIGNIRTVVFDDTNTEHIPAKLKRYHRFHAERDLQNIVRWLWGAVQGNPEPAGFTPRTSIPHNLPALQPFFGREEELKKIADALDHDNRIWGAIIDGPGGIGKTSLAVRAAYDVPGGSFDRIAFVSLKSRELDPEGIRELGGFLINGLTELLNELAREFGLADFAKILENERPRQLLDVLRNTKALLVLDNLESLPKPEKDVIFTFVKKLPFGCKAILTARGRIGSGAEEIILGQLEESAALATLAKLAENNLALGKTSEIERRDLYHITGGNPLLLFWTACQIGRGNCLTLKHAIDYLRSCSEKNDPLEYIFGDLISDFTEGETKILCALSYYTMPASVGHIAEIAECSRTYADIALRTLTNRSLVAPNEDLTTFRLVSLVADFLRKKKPEIMAKTGHWLEKHVYAIVVENGYEKYDQFHVLDTHWPTIAAALTRFLIGQNNRLQTICDALRFFLEFTGRWDEWLALSKEAEKSAIATADFYNAGWRAYWIGWIQYLRSQPEEVLTSAKRATEYWQKAEAEIREQAYGLRLRGLGYQLKADYSLAKDAYREALQLFQTISLESSDVALCFNSLANAEHFLGDFNAAERNYREGLRIAKAVDYPEGIATYIGNLADLALDRENWSDAEMLAKEALTLSEKIGRIEIVGINCIHIAKALVHQNQKSEAVSYARRAVKILEPLKSSNLGYAQEILAECEQV